MAKRIILLLDGTWNDADMGVADTNIVRLREIIADCLDPVVSTTETELIAPDSSASRLSISSGKYETVANASLTSGEPKFEKHLVYYERGVGTGGFFDLYFGGAFGAGLSRNIRRAYRFLSQNYETGDQVFVFGFSRGSYTARSLVGYIGAVGLLEKRSCSEENESRAWYYYRTTPNERLSIVADGIRALSHRNVRINCLAVFDTVGALGIPLPAFSRENRDLYEFHDVGLSANADLNLHALALDEHRRSFEPTLWRQQKFGLKSSNTEQVWFAGAHSDVGGGHIDEDLRKLTKSPALDDLTLDWMLKRILKRYSDFPVKKNGKPAWPRISKRSSSAEQHEPRLGFYRATPFAWRSINNWPVRSGSHEANVARDRHAKSVGEAVHVSALERLGRAIKINGRFVHYAPKNLVHSLDHLEASIINSEHFAVIGYSGYPLKGEVALFHINRAKDRLRRVGCKC